MQVCASCKSVARDNASFVPAAPRWLGLLLLLQRPENAHGMPMRPFTLAFFSLKTIVHIRIFSSFFLFLLPLATWTTKHVFVQKNTIVFFKDISFHVSFHVKFGYVGHCDFSINNPQNTCLVMWILTWNILYFESNIL